MKHLVIPDTQVKPGEDFGFLRAIGRYIVAKKPDKIIQIGDFADMSSLSSYDVGKRAFEGRRYQSDIRAAKEAMGELLGPLHEFNRKAKANREKQYRPELHLNLGNHEHRIERAIENDPKLEGTLSINDLGYEDAGWKVHPFLQVNVLDGIAYSHYFPSGPKSNPIGNARLILLKQHMSCIAGHLQGRDIAYGRRADGKTMTAIIAGSCYEHDEPYLSPLENRHFRGLYVLHEVDDGQFCEMPVSLDYIKKKYGD